MTCDHIEDRKYLPHFCYSYLRKQSRYNNINDVDDRINYLIGETSINETGASIEGEKSCATKKWIQDLRYRVYLINHRGCKLTDRTTTEGGKAKATASQPQCRSTSPLYLGYNRVHPASFNARSEVTFKTEIITNTLVGQTASFTSLWNLTYIDWCENTSGAQNGSFLL